LIPNLFLQLPGGMEWPILIVVVVVLIFGASRIPKLARSLGRATGEFQKGKIEAQREAEALKNSEPINEEEERLKLIKTAKQLGISYEGKSNEEIREEIRKNLDIKP